ncbi:MAG: EAL domain-containing protein [Planctomycetota bacterium]
MQAHDLRAQAEVGAVVLNGRDVTDRKAWRAACGTRPARSPHQPAQPAPVPGAFRRLAGAQRARERIVRRPGRVQARQRFLCHGVGDQLLRATAARLFGCLGPKDLLARQGGDEFLVLCRRGGAEVAQRILAALTPPFTIDEREMFVTASIGLHEGLGDDDADEAVRRADVAMYEAKKAGRDRCVAFTEAMLASAPEEMRMDTEFRRALERREFSVFYQPKVGLQSGKIESLEALVRWQHPERGFVRPDLFISFAERSGLVCELGHQVLEQACLDAARWQERGIVVAVNLSPVQFRNPNLVQEVRDALADSGLDPELLELEITGIRRAGRRHQHPGSARGAQGFGPTPRSTTSAPATRT